MTSQNFSTIGCDEVGYSGHAGGGGGRRKNARLVLGYSGTLKLYQRVADQYFMFR